jgi:hypothetical protein
MNAAPRRHLVWLILGVALMVTPSLAAAASAVTVRTTGISTGPGVCNITIESFGTLLTGDRRGVGTLGTTAPVYNINCPVPNGQNAATTANQLAACIDAVLPADYVVAFAPAADVTINRTTGTFTISISEDIPTQQIAVVNNVPGADTLRVIVAALALYLAGGVFILRRRRIV